MARLRPEHSFALACGIAAATGTPLERKPSAALHWDVLEACARDHQLRPDLASGIDQLGMGGEAADRIRAVARVHRGNALLAAGELHRLLGVLDKAGVRAVPFKGPAFAALVAAGDGTREVCDLDLLVAEGDIERAARALEALGYEPALPRQALRSRWLAHATDELPLSSRGGILVELHWRIGQRWYPTTLDVAHVIAASGTREVHGEPVRWPSPEHLLLLHVADGMKSGGCALRWLADLAAILHRHPGIDMQAVHAIAARNGGWRTVRIALAALARAWKEVSGLLGEAPPALLAAFDADDRGVRHAVERMFDRINANERPAGPWAQFGWALAIADRPVRAGIEVARYLGAPAAADLRTMASPEPSALAMRWQTLCRRIGRAHG